MESFLLNLLYFATKTALIYNAILMYKRGDYWATAVYVVSLLTINNRF